MRLHDRIAELERRVDWLYSQAPKPDPDAIDWAAFDREVTRYGRRLIANTYRGDLPPWETFGLQVPE